MEFKKSFLSESIRFIDLKNDIVYFIHEEERHKRKIRHDYINNFCYIKFNKEMIKI